MSFDDFKKNINENIDDKDIDLLIESLKENSIDGKINDAGKIFSIYKESINQSLKKSISLLELYHNWLFENFDIREKN